MRLLSTSQTRKVELHNNNAESKEKLKEKKERDYKLKWRWERAKSPRNRKWSQNPVRIYCSSVSKKKK